MDVEISFDFQSRHLTSASSCLHHDASPLLPSSSLVHRDFHDWVDDNDIMVEAFPMEAYGDAKRVCTAQPQYPRCFPKV